MPAIWNVGTLNQANEKKVSSKLTFEVGESFKGRIVSEGDGNEVVVKLTDGWQFSAELTGENISKDGRMVQFEVEGFEDGKLKLKIVEGQQGKEKTSSGDIVDDFLNKEGISKSDSDILKAMVKHNIPLTKENISFVKSVLTFSGKISNNSNEIEQFINKFISGRGIDLESVEGQNIKSTLNNFFDSFKTMGEKDILLFLENDIEFTKENIDSYNKLFKEDGNMKEFFEKISKELEKMDLPKGNLDDINLEENINSKSIESENEQSVLSKNIASKIYDANVPTKEKLSILSLIKSISGNEMELVKDSFKDIIKETKNNFNSSEVKGMLVKLESMTDEDIMNSIKKTIANEGITKDSIDKVVSNILGKEVHLSESSSEKLMDIINLKLSEEKPSTKENGGANTSNNNIINNGKTTEEGNSVKQGATSTKINEAFSTTAKVSKEDIIQNKGIQNSNIADKKAVINEAIKNNSIQTNSSSTEIVKSELNQKIENMKEIIKDIMIHTQLKGEGMEKVMDFIKSNINDFKMLNSISNEYYYLDVPVNKSGKEYPCKLIIKDNRKDNKKIDKTNVKVVVAVKTLNIGTVDGYLTVHDKNLTVDLKCEEQFVKPIELSKDKLVKMLQEIGFFVNITVSKKIEEVNLTSCRDFFDKSNQNAIDIKV
ncbi:flagellar hook-length control protein FliK [Clostridium cibarium]|uniref:Flagellar hook-length control protein FliK n=1 Tax=Clostridium cibarium TaxID=2762247 RepID=A0ABR8PPZ2_9CLOT|nr:flagellar hook-length control protein FliK [Clostridium cibarium]MBD7910237.1 flagellar hook-length control protein FliK [Clostridium cibarium]